MKDLKKLIESENLPQFEITPENVEEEYQKFLMDIIAQVVKLRIDRGLSQTDLAKLSGLKQSAISRFENLGSNPTLKFLFKLLKALDGKIEIVSKKKRKTSKEIHINLIRPEKGTTSEYVIDLDRKTWREKEIWKVS